MSKNVATKCTEILIAEDSLTQATQIKHLLESHNYKVSVAQNGKQALDLLKKQKPSIVISDIMMPEMNGYELCKKIKSNRNTENIPVILLTILADPEEIIEGLSCGADSFITKPYNEKHLLSNIEKILSAENRDDYQKVPFGVQILFNGEKRTIQAEQQNVIKLMLDIYEGAIHQNERLVLAQDELRLLNEQLESKVEDRTSDLKEEIKLSNQIAEKLTESENKWRTLVLTMPEYIGLVDHDGKFLFLNHYAKGFSEKDTIGKSHLEFIPDEWKEFYKQKFEKCINTQKNQLFEYTAYGDNKTLRTYETCLVPIIQQGKVSNVMAIARDITERKQSEEKLINSEERLKILFEYAPDAYYLSDLKGTFIDGNIACEKLLGYNKNELIGKNFLKLDLLSFKQLPRAAKLLVKNSLNQTTGPDEFVLKRKDGSEVAVEIITHPVKIKDQTLILGIARDITERKQAEKLLRESEEKFRSIMENSADAIFITDQQGKYLYTNKAVTVMLGFTSEEMKSKTISDITPRNETDKYLGIFNQTLRDGYIFAEIELLKKDGNFISTDLNSVLLPDGLVYGSCRDITERKLVQESLKLAKEKAETSDKLKTSFLNNISHEVRTPLNGILGFAEIMSQTELSEEEKKTSLSMLFESSDRLLNTITNYMDISLVTSGNMTLYKKDFFPTRILRELFSKNEVKCTARNLELLLKIPDQTENISINSDPEVLNKILSHLLNNAVKFTEKGSIKFGYMVRRNELEFFVKDTGIGIGKDSFISVFEHFVKENRGPLDLTEGSGLGLSISKGLVELLGGKIWVESERGKGSAFFFIIPVEKEFENHIINTTKEKQKRNKTANSILVAEDDEINFFYLQALLRQNTSAEIIHAANGKEAVDLFMQNPGIGLILMDIKMPVMDGLEATRQIKAIKRDVPVIAITAYAMAGDEARILDAGCDYYMTKPFNKKLLFARMAEFIEV